MNKILNQKQNRFGHLEIGFWNLFGICYLGFGILNGSVFLQFL